MATVLVIEDNEANLKFARDVLATAGYGVLEARSVDAGLQIARSQLPSLIILDIQLPGMDGITGATLIKADPKIRDTPLIACTALAMAGDERRILSAGFDAYLPKPVRYKELLSRVQEALAS